jgi:hypothetical protein
MKRFIGVGVILWCGLLLCGCDGAYSPPVDVTAVAAPIATQVPGGSSILVPPTLSPDHADVPPGAQAGDTVALTLTNDSSWSVCYVYITIPEAATWGEDWLGNDEEINLDATRVFDVPAGIYDVRAESCDYIPLNETYQVDLNTPYDWHVVDPALSFTEYFDAEGSWNVKGSGAAGEVRSGAYYLSSSPKGSLAISQPGKNLSDMVVTVEAMPTAPADVSQVAYGVMCRVQTNGDGYLFLARGDGMYAVEKVSGGKMSALVDWKHTDQINPGADLNVVEANCNGDALAIRLNGLTVEKLTDSSFQQGDVALVVLPLGSDSAEVQFDNLVVTQPGQ